MKSDKNQRSNQTLIKLAPVEVSVFGETVLPQTVRTSLDSHRKHPLLVLQNDGLGHVVPPDGTKLLAGLISQFVVIESLPSAIIMQGAAVRLTADNNPASEVLSRLVTLHVPLLICSESLDTLKIASWIEGGRIVSQRAIAEQLLSAEQVLWF